MSKTVMLLSTVPDERPEAALKTAADLGYRTIMCAEEPNAQLEEAADAYYVADWSDTEELLRIARKEHIDGAVGLCDPAMIPAAEITEALGLAGNSPECMESFISKEGFRELQKKAGVFCPASAVAESADELASKCAGMDFPVIIKPMLCSSSHGMTVVENPEDIKAAFPEAAGYSRNGMVCAEEFISNDELRIIEADVFLFEDDILWDGIRWCYRLESAPLRPACDVYPVNLSDAQMSELKEAVTAVLRTSGARIGEYNVEGFFTPEGRFFIVEINPRQAGIYNPLDIQDYCGVDLTKLLLTTSVGDRSYYEELKSFRRTRFNILTISVFSIEGGVFDHIHVDPSISDALIAFRYLHGQKAGDRVGDIITAVRPIAHLTFRFGSEEELERARVRITERVYPVMRNLSRGC